MRGAQHRARAGVVGRRDRRAGSARVVRLRCIWAGFVWDSPEDGARNAAVAAVRVWMGRMRGISILTIWAVCSSGHADRHLVRQRRPERKSW